MKTKIFALLLAVLLVLGCFVGCSSENGEQSGGEQTTVAGDNKETIIPEDSDFAVHFIDVGQADAALVVCDGKTMLIDGGNAEDSDLMYTYLVKQGITYLDYVVSTHAHEDHVGGIAGALTAVKDGVGTVYSPVTEADTDVFKTFVKKVQSMGKELTVPKAGDTFSLGEATVQILGPRKSYDDANDTSIVLRVVYGETSFLFTGDMESAAEADLLAAGVSLKSTVLKVGHHGSDSSTSYRFLREVAPIYAIISVGAGNTYGHPSETVLSRLRDADAKVYRTDLQGDIVCTSNGEKLTFQTTKNSDKETNPTEEDRTTSSTSAVTSYAYIGNVNTRKFHDANCGNLPEEANRIYFTSRQEAIEKGYSACGNCKP